MNGDPVDCRTKETNPVEVARDQAWIYLKRTGRKFCLEIHHDGGPWGWDRQVKIPLTRKQATEVEGVFRA